MLKTKFWLLFTHICCYLSLIYFEGTETDLKKKRSATWTEACITEKQLFIQIPDGSPPDEERKSGVNFMFSFPSFKCTLKVISNQNPTTTTTRIVHYRSTSWLLIVDKDI